MTAPTRKGTHMHGTSRTLRLAVTGGAIAALALASTAPATVAAAFGSQTFAATGANQTFTVPAGVTTAGGGGGSSFASSPSNFTQGTHAQADGSATASWLTWAPASPTAAQQDTLTANVGNGAPGGTEAFVEGSTTLCVAVPVAADGTATCQSTFAVGSHAVTATYAGQASAGQSQFNGLFETSAFTVTIVPPTPTTVRATGAVAPAMDPVGPAVLLAVAVLCAALIAATTRRRAQP